MILGEPLGLIALAGLPAVLALHLWRARHAPLPVSALFLWPADRRVLASGRRRAPIVLRPSFWLEILAVLALTWWLADVHWSPRQSARHLIIVLDDRWRLQATDQGRSAADRLRVALEARLAHLADGDRATLIASGAPPRLLAGPAAEAAVVSRALSAWQPQAGWHDPDAAFALAAGLGGSGAEILWAGDRTPERLPAGAGVVAVGLPATSGGLADAHWWRDAQGERIVAVRYGPPRRLRLLLAGVEVAGDERSGGAVVFAPLPPCPEGAEAELILDGDDALPLDDRARILRPIERSVRATLDPATPADVVRAVRAVGIRTDAGPAHLAIGGSAAPGVWSLQLIKGPGPPTRGPFTSRHEHPLLADLDWTGALWSGGLADPTVIPLLVSGEHVLLGQRPGAFTELVLGVDLPATDLGRHTAWPALFANLAAWRAAALPGLSDPNPRCGQPLTATLPEGVFEAELSAPDGTTRRLRADRSGHLAISALDRPGRWNLRVGEAAWPISVLPLDTRQGDLAGAESVAREPAALGQAAIERTRSPLASLLPLVLAAAAAFAAWAAFRREERP